jgi:hypothetical protein
VEQFFYEHMRKKCESLSSSQRQSERSFWFKHVHNT